MIKIKLKIISHLIYKTGFGERDLELPQPVTVEELLTKINLENKIPMVIIRNGKVVDLKEQVQDGDRIVISPFFFGG